MPSECIDGRWRFTGYDDLNAVVQRPVFLTVNGVVGTLAWDSFREAVDDTRYVATLEKAIVEADDAEVAQGRHWSGCAGSTRRR